MLVKVIFLLLAHVCIAFIGNPFEYQQKTTNHEKDDNSVQCICSWSNVQNWLQKSIMDILKMSLEFAEQKKKGQLLHVSKEHTYDLDRVGISA